MNKQTLLSAMDVVALFGFAYLKAQSLLDDYRTDSEVLRRLRQRYDIKESE